MAEPGGQAVRSRRSGPRERKVEGQELEAEELQGATSAARTARRGGEADTEKEESRRSEGFGITDIVRVLAGILILNFAASWFITNESLTWGYRPWWTKSAPLSRWLAGPLHLTDDQLSAYNGSDPAKPLYLALNGTIYDVSAGRLHYGPGASYSIFAGRDATRAFITGCFQTDLTPDIRGAEEVFMPVDDDEDEEDAPSELHSGNAEVEREDGELRRKGGKKGPKKAELKMARERDRRLARKKVQDTIEGWAKMFRGDANRPYFTVGKGVREEGWLEKVPRRELCSDAQKQRPKRSEVQKSRVKEGKSGEPPVSI